MKMKRLGKDFFYWMIVILSCGAAGVYLSFASVLNPISIRMPGTDATVFIRGALGMINGETLYVDFWDHKGPLLFFIQWIGLNLTPHSLTGIWLLEVLCASLTMLAFFFISKLITNSTLLSIIASFFSIQSITTFYELGNTVEEYALPLIAFSAFFFVRYIKTREMNRLQVSLSGFFMSCVFLINGNMFATWIAFIPVIIIMLVRDKKLNELRTMITFFVIGLLIPLIATVIIMGIKGNLSAFLDIYFGFNAGYIKGQFSFGKYLHDLKVTIFDDNFFLAFECLGALILIKEKFIEKNSIDYRWVGYVYTIVTLALFNISGRGFSHYALQLIPCMVIPASICLVEINRWCKTRWLFMICMLVFVLGFYRFNVKYFFNRYVHYTVTYDTHEDSTMAKKEYLLDINEWLDKKWSNELIEEWML